MNILVTFGILIAYLGVFGALGQYVAHQNGRSLNEGIVFAILLGPIGLLIVAVLPSKRAP